MKGFTIISIVFIAMLVAIFINQYFVRSIYEELIKRADAMTIELSEENIARLESFNSYWTDNVPFLKISIPSRTIRNLSNEIAALDAAYTVRDKSHVAIHLQLLKNAIEEMMDCEVSILSQK